MQYKYNGANELTRENNQFTNQTVVYTYDTWGNLATKKIYAYTTATNPGTPTSTITYGYGNSAWKDQLTSYNGQTIAVLKNTPRDTGLDYTRLAPIAAYLKGVRKQYAAYESKLQGVDINVVRHQIPGGMRSNLETQLAQMNASDRLGEVLEEVVRVRADLGYPPLGTPFSQMCGAQAATNVLTGKRYCMISKEVKAYVRGEYGRAPGKVSEELKRLVLREGEMPLTCRPADLLEPVWEQRRQEIGDLARSDEDVLTYAMFPQVGRAFLEKKYGVVQ